MSVFLWMVKKIFIIFMVKWQFALGILPLYNHTCKVWFYLWFRWGLCLCREHCGGVTVLHTQNCVLSFPHSDYFTVYVIFFTRGYYEDPWMFSKGGGWGTDRFLINKHLCLCYSRTMMAMVVKPPVRFPWLCWISMALFLAALSSYRSTAIWL